jgi:hypothetical protein
MSKHEPQPLPEAPAFIGRPPETVAGRRPDDDWELSDPQPMGPATIAALRGLIRALCPAPPAPWSEDLAARVELGVRHFLPYMPPIMGHGFGYAVHLLDWSPLWAFAGLRRLQHMERVDAGRVLQRLSTSPIKPVRLLIMAARAAVLSTYYDQDEVHQAMGYHPQAFLQQRADLRRRLLAGEAPAPDDDIGPYAEVLR